MVHSPRSSVPAGDPPRAAPALIAAVGTAEDADRAIAAGADMIDGSGLTGPAAAALRARNPGAPLWTGAPEAVDADQAATVASTVATTMASTEASTAAPVAAVVATAAIMTWLGAPAIRTRHVVAVRRAIDMTSSIAGTRPPALTTRGLA